jgi:class 3 adenylate cyclase
VNSERVERRLAVILAADVAGYSRLMGRDEEGTRKAVDVLDSGRKEVPRFRLTRTLGKIVMAVNKPVGDNARKGSG